MNPGRSSLPYFLDKEHYAEGQGPEAEKGPNWLTNPSKNSATQWNQGISGLKIKSRLGKEKNCRNANPKEGKKDTWINRFSSFQTI